MPEDKILRFPSKLSKDEAERIDKRNTDAVMAGAATSTPIQTTGDTDTFRFSGHVMTEHQRVEKIQAMGEFLESLQAADPSSYSEENIQKRQEGLRGHTMGDLQNMIAISGENDWRERPSFYHAVRRELRRKIALLRQEGADIPDPEQK